ncbi:hypothetical protein HYH03_010467 [Edaphochlamys debaryana]|uniref:Calcineurin-like phosphoesterase domain-containing protein n=1 Tax=Edaphochlamys debaryana TaxID=47281 RepID=A0A836BW20_9CHLO|nr:hypothetical protein HYH03_010467 [Edaphochlamys debaryana]|eukprot:KAG2491261.1 hypothetical protein HYH03_010467 [Edaphochlamys debaryana]
MTLGHMRFVSVRAHAATAAPAGVTPGTTLAKMSTKSRSEPWQLAVMGDLHLAPEQMHLFHAARSHLLAAMSEEGKPVPGARVAQLGDLGHGKHASGSQRCFKFAKDFLDGFGVPYAMITGNHDLEGDEYETDEANLSAWKEVFDQPHYWSADLGSARLLGLSTVRYRSNENSHHEVYISHDQVQWLEGQLAEHPHTPFIVLTHAPPMGCGLKVIQEVHIKNRCAWLNHSQDPKRFLDIVSRHKNIKLWFSGHFHLSHNYPDSISTVGSTAFVQVGVIGECNRDGLRQSRLLRGTPSGYELFTVDHDTGATRLDLAADWADTAPPVPVTPADELLCDPSAGWLCSQMDCKVGDNIQGLVTWYPVGSETILALHDGGLLIEYDMATAAPIGLVTRVPEDCRLQPVTAQGSPCAREDGADVAEIRVLEADGSLREALPRNSAGAFYRVYQPNKWKLKRAQKQAQAQSLVAV